MTEPQPEDGKRSTRGLGAKAKDRAKEQFGADPYSSPEDNTVSFTVGAVRRLLALEIERARR